MNKARATAGETYSLQVMCLGAGGGVNTPTQVPSRRIQGEDRVFIRPLPANAGVVALGRYGAEVGVTANAPDFINKGDQEREFPVQNLSQIFIGGANTDGVAIQVRSAGGVRQSSEGPNLHSMVGGGGGKQS